MDQALDLAEVSWYKINNNVIANVIYLSKYIFFTLTKIPSEIGDMYELTIPSRERNQVIYMFLNKLACCGLKFKFDNIVYELDDEFTYTRLYNEEHVSFHISNISDVDDDEMIDDCMYEDMHETLDDLHNITTSLLNISAYIRYVANLDREHFTTGNRWVQIATRILELSKSLNMDCDSLCGVAMYTLNSFLVRFGKDADTGLIHSIHEYAHSIKNNPPKYNPLLVKYSGEILDTIYYIHSIVIEI
jgi:hypothetical protein